MKKVALIFATEGGTCEDVCKRLVKHLGEENVELVEVIDANKDLVESYDSLILASSTSGVGELQPDWDDLIDDFDEIDFSSKNIALLGLGDQDSYPDSFCGCISYLYEKVKEGNVVGFTFTDGYEFEETDAIVDGQFVGLAIDEVNQEELTDERLEKWAIQIKDDLGL